MGSDTARDGWWAVNNHINTYQNHNINLCLVQLSVKQRAACLTRTFLNVDVWPTAVAWCGGRWSSLLYIGVDVCLVIKHIQKFVSVPMQMERTGSQLGRYICKIVKEDGFNLKLSRHFQAHLYTCEQECASRFWKDSLVRSVRSP